MPSTEWTMRGEAVLEQAAQQCVGLLAGAFQSDDACAFVQ